MSDSWDWKTPLKKNAFSFPTAQPDVRDASEVQKRVMGLLKCDSDMRCVAFATWRPQQAQQHLISSQLAHLTKHCYCCLGINLLQTKPFSGSTDPSSRFITYTWPANLCISCRMQCNPSLYLLFILWKWKYFTSILTALLKVIIHNFTRQQYYMLWGWVKKRIACSCSQTNLKPWKRETNSSSFWLMTYFSLILIANTSTVRRGGNH